MVIDNKILEKCSIILKSKNLNHKFAYVLFFADFGYDIDSIIAHPNTHIYLFEYYKSNVLSKAMPFSNI